MREEVPHLGPKRIFLRRKAQLHHAISLIAVLTDELSVGNYFKRLTAIENQLGTVDHHLARYAALAEAEAEAA
jgi:hypothetical protein